MTTLYIRDVSDDVAATLKERSPLRGTGRMSCSCHGLTELRPQTGPEPPECGHVAES